MNRFYKTAVIILIIDRLHQEWKSLYRWKCDICSYRTFAKDFDVLDNLMFKHQKTHHSEGI